MLQKKENLDANDFGLPHQNALEALCSANLRFPFQIEKRACRTRTDYLESATRENNAANISFKSEIIRYSLLSALRKTGLANHV